MFILSLTNVPVCFIAFSNRSYSYVHPLANNHQKIYCKVCNLFDTSAKMCLTSNFSIVLLIDIGNI